MKIPRFRASDMLTSGSLWTDRIAPMALPILLWAATKSRRITYTQLADEIHRRTGEAIKPRKTLYGKPAGKIGHAIERLSAEWSEDIPPINAILVRSDKRHLPGSGANSFISRYLANTAEKTLTEANRDALAEEVIQSVFDYPDWDRVRRYFRLPVLEAVPCLTHPTEKPINLPPPKPAKGGPEGHLHKLLKTWVASHSQCVSRFGAFPQGDTEVPLSSGDAIDVSFQNDETWLCAEIKDHRAKEGELVRGVFQCVKYRATMRAMQLARGGYTNAQAILVTQAPLPSKAQSLAKRLRVTHINVGSQFPRIHG